MSETVTTAGLEPGEDEAYWRYVMGDVFVPVTIDRVSTSRFGGSIRSDSIGRMMVGHVSATGQHIQHTERHICDAAAPYFQVTVATSGTGRVAQDGRETELRAGDCAVYETMRPFQWHFDEHWDVSVFTFPLEVVALTESERRLVTARRMPSSAALTGVVTRFLVDLERNSEQLLPERSERLVTQASDLVVTLLADLVDASDAARSSAQRTLMLRIKDYIGQRLTDQDLRPPESAAAVNISPRYLHKLFEDEHHTVALYIRQLRLERCRRELLDRRLSHHSISSIATGCGFGDLSGFNRAFKRTYGLSPSDLRATTLST